MRPPTASEKKGGRKSASEAQPGLVEASLGAKRTEELAVMWDTFKPLRLTTLARDTDQPDYALSWYEPEGAEVGTTTTG